MTVARFSTERVALTPDANPNTLVMDTYLNPVLIEIEDTGTADSVNTLHHGLGRVPRGCRIVNVALPSASAPASPGWYRKETGSDSTDDDPWTDTDMDIRFSHNNLRVLLEVF